MKEIKLKELRLLNFKNFRSYQVKFNKERTTISGANGLGKSTILDAFCWCLFDKDSLDRKQFQLKTLENGRVIENVPHEVLAILEVDNREVAVRRVLKEKWSKKRGSEIAEFTGNYEERFINDVPCSVNEFAKKINEIITEDEFKALTNTTYFLQKDWQEQRDFLLKMSGDVSDEEVITDNSEFITLFNTLQAKGITIEEYAKELKSKKKRIKEDSESYLPKIEQQQENLANLNGESTIDFEEKEKELHAKEKELSEIEEKILNNNAPAEEWLKQIKDFSKKIADKERKKFEKESEIRHALKCEYDKKVKELDNIDFEINVQASKINIINNDIDRKQKQIADKEKENELLRKDFTEVANTTLQIDTDMLACPTCGRPYDEAKQEEQKANIIADFNRKMAQKKEEIRERGKRNNEQINKLEQEVEELQKEKEEKIKLRTEKENKKANLPEIKAPAYEEEIANNTELQKISKEIEDLQNEQVKISNEQPKADNTEFVKQKEQIKIDIDNIKAILMKKGLKEQYENSILDLKEKYQKAVTEVAEIEQMELAIADFNLEKIKAIEKKVNALFSKVQFRLFKTQINENSVETCEALWNGIPYSVMSNAQKILAGLDVIQAISKFYETKAPIFIDNAEALSSEVTAETQLIKMRVTTDDELKVF